MPEMSDKAQESSTPPQPETGSAEAKIKKYDFLAAEQLSAEQAHVLREVNALAASCLADLLKEHSRSPAEIEAGETTQVAAPDLKSKQWGSEVVVAFNTADESSQALLVVDNKLALLLVDCTLGGASTSAAADRPLTELERQVFAHAAEALILQYAQAWSKLVSFSPQVVEVKSSAPTDESLSQTSRAIVTEFSVTIDQFQAKMLFYLLLPGCDKLIEKLNSQRWAANRATLRAEDRQKVARILSQVDLPVRALLGKTKISVSDWVSISVGDVICLDLQEAHQVRLLTCANQAFLGEPVSMDGELGVRVSCQLDGGGE
jgi:flagellar motor switch protein FliM